MRHRGIFEWIESFVESTNLSGMVSFEFIVDKGDQAFCTGCALKLNPVISIFANGFQVNIKTMPNALYLKYLTIYT